MKHRRLLTVILPALLLAVLLSVCICVAGKWEWEDVPRVIVIGDVHGSYDDTVKLLEKLGLIDSRASWTGGQDHLVFVGDLLDRGPREREVLDLVRRLQTEAPRTDGWVHLLLGNHEIMNLVRDLRYVEPEGYSSFQDLEDPADRREAWQRYLATMKETGIDEQALATAFNKKYPPGYFGRSAAFGPGGQYASWLLSLPIAIKINRMLFVHAGLTEEVAGLGLEGINRKVRNDIQAFWDARAVLEAHGESRPEHTFRELMDIAAAIQAHRGIQKIPEIRDAAVTVRNVLDSYAVRPDGPLWYRGTAGENERVEKSRVENVLSALDAEMMVVGHTITQSGKITTRFNRKVIKIDTGMYRRHQPQALVLEGGGVKVFDLFRNEMVSARPEPPQGRSVDEEYDAMPDAFLERYLQKAEIEEIRPLGRGSTRPLLLDLEDGGVAVRGLYKNVSERVMKCRRIGAFEFESTDRYQHEVAAYKLDRMLGLGMVPVTVERSLGNRGKGSVQQWIDQAIDNLAAGRWILTEEYRDEVSAQWDRINVFDALIGNADREDSDILHLEEDRKILLVDHSEAFCTGTELEPFLQGRECFIDQELRQALKALNLKDLRSQLGSYLSKKQIAAIMQRRDLLLDTCGRRSEGTGCCIRQLPARP